MLVILFINIFLFFKHYDFFLFAAILVIVLIFHVFSSVSDLDYVFFLQYGEAGHRPSILDNPQLAERYTYTVCPSKFWTLEIFFQKFVKLKGDLHYLARM